MRIDFVESLLEFALNALHWLFNRVTQQAVVEAFGYAVLFAAIALAIDLVWVGWKGSSLRRLANLRNPSVVADIAIFVLASSSLSFLFGNLMVFGLSNTFSSSVLPLIRVEIARELPPWLHFLLLVFVFDFLAYWKHRLGHTVPFLWQLHRIHHSATEMTVLTNHRNHPVEVVISSMAHGFAAALLGVPTETLFAVVAATSILGDLKHSNVSADWGWFGKYGLQSPKLHHIHHSRQPRFHNKNFAELFSIWDVAFGTYAATSEKVDDFGLTNDPLNSKSFVHDLVSTTFAMYASLLSGILRVLRLRTITNSGDPPLNG
jgi:sterol desaturase/sphingolipid hydroxylase (fatty acid hydroxylase superfamily)